VDNVQFAASKWLTNRKWFRFCEALVVIYSMLTFGSIFILYSLYVPQYEFKTWEQILWTLVIIANVPFCKWLQIHCQIWEIYLDAYERKNGLNTDYLQWKDQMIREGKLRRY